jgi:hypothetical protein
MPAMRLSNSLCTIPYIGVSSLCVMLVALDVRCPHCGGWHPLTQPYLNRSTAEREFVYFSCDGRRFFAGASPEQVRPETRAVSPCPLCQGQRCVCEQHPSSPWPHDTCNGPGVPCPAC